jgi:L-amino acid N-acyltransferase YncA
MSDIVLRDAAPGDASEVAAIYAHHVLHGTASFDTEPPPVAFWEDKIASVTARAWPFVVATEAGAIVGYAYATQFRDRPAYRHTCENSIYVHPDWVGRGIGGRMLALLIERARMAGFLQMIAVIGGGEPASVRLHAKAGFIERGRMHRVGHKFGRWLDSVYMQRSLGQDAAEVIGNE